MALPAPLAKWARDAGEAFAALEDAEGMLASIGIQLRSHFSSVEDMKAQELYEPLRLEFKAAYCATGKKEGNVPSNWASILYQYAWPGTGKVRGRFYKLDEQGNSVLDQVRNLPTPPGSASPAPDYLRSMPLISPEEVMEKGGWPLRIILAAGSGGGKTTLTRQLLEAVLPKLDIVVIVTGTLKEHWAGLPPKVEVLEFDDDPELERVKEVIATQKEMVRTKSERIGAPLFLFDDIGDKGGAKRGKLGELLDSFYMTLRNFGIGVIAISQQQNK